MDGLRSLLRSRESDAGPPRPCEFIHAVNDYHASHGSPAPVRKSALPRRVYAAAPAFLLDDPNLSFGQNQEEVIADYLQQLGSLPPCACATSVAAARLPILRNRDQRWRRAGDQPCGRSRARGSQKNRCRPARENVRAPTGLHLHPER